MTLYCGLCRDWVNSYPLGREIKKAGIAVLIERFADLPDQQVEGRTDHDLLDIAMLALCAVISGTEG